MFCQSQVFPTEKSQICLAVFDFQKKPKFQNLSSKKSNGQPCQKACAVAYCLYCEPWIPLPLWRNYRMGVKSESSQPWLGYLKALRHCLQWNHMRTLIAWHRSSPDNVTTARFANFGDLDEILQLRSSFWQLTFCKSLLLASRWLLTFRNYYVTLRHQFGAPRT